MPLPPLNYYPSANQDAEDRSRETTFKNIPNNADVRKSN